MTDVCLILEGTYPYKTGGVATWIHALVTDLPDTTFSLAHLYYGPKPSVPRFSLPANVKSLVLIPLNDRKSPVSMSDLLSLVPDAKIYHALSTGFAGLLGTEMKMSRGFPLILTEHGIYWHEVSQGVDELECGFKIVKRETGDLFLGTTWRTWESTFQNLARDAYAAADVITTVCSFNQSLQRSLGALESKMQLIPNGVTVSGNGVVPSQKSMNGRLRIALVGRVTAIKDVKTFIRACALVQKKIPDAQFVVIGPTDHDARYSAECKELASILCPNGFEFTGEVDVETQYPSIKIVVLTSVSEALPYAVLESFAHGIPVVVTDVGGCSQLVQKDGSSGEQAGILCPVGDIDRISQAIVELSTNEALYQQCSQEGLKRAKTLFSRSSVSSSYKRIYDQFLTCEK
jgi:glycosyltransferase involved in cell wall biosynthesis